MLLKSVPFDLYEAAKVDGAGLISRFFKITIPMLAPAITICVGGITMGSLKVYDLLVASTKGGPGEASTSVIYQMSLTNTRYGIIFMYIATGISFGVFLMNSFRRSGQQSEVWLPAVCALR